jgi:hypothetical protein
VLPARFSYHALVDADDRARLVGELAAALTARLQGVTDAESESYALIEELRALGHDLWSFDCSPGVGQHWCGDWVTPRRPFELLITFSYRPRSEAMASFRPRFDPRD